MRNKLFTLLFALLASVGMMKAAVVNGTCGDNLTWSLNSKDSTLTIEGSGVMTSCPWSEYKNYIAHVTLPEGLTQISAAAFNACNHITAIVLPSTVENIGNDAFGNCKNLISVSLNCRLKRIGNAAFYGCSALTSIEIPDSVTDIGQSPFRDCSSLTSLKIGNGLTEIGWTAFMDCTSLQHIEIGCNISKMDGNAFTNCNQITSVIWNAKSGPEKHFGSTVESFVFGDSVQTIPNGICSGMKKIYNMVIPKNVTSIGYGAFNNSNISTLTIWAATPPSGGANSGIDASSCTLYVPYSSINIYQNSIWWEDFADIQAIPGTEPCITASGTCGENVTWEISCDGVLSISGTGEMQNYESYAPWYDYAVHTLIVEEGVTTIGRIAFIELPLEEIHLSSTVTRIGEAAFERCGLLKNIQLPQNLRVIDFGAFQGDSLLESVTLPNSVDSIGNYAFAQCKSLTAPIYNDHIFARLPMSYQGHYTIPDGITVIAGTAFETCEGLTDVTFSASVEEIGDMAFSYCSSLTSVDLSPFVGTLKSGTFYYCQSLTTAHIGKNVQHILYNPFDHCEQFTSFTLDESNPYFTLDNGLLYSKDKKRLILCPTAKRVGLNDLAKTITSVAPGALFYTTNIDSIAFPEGVTFIGDRVLVGSSVKYIVLPSTLDSIGDYAFSIYHKYFQAIVSYAQTPPKIAESKVPFFHNNGPDTLYVPKGAADAYKNAMGWSSCPLIVEMEPTTPPCEPISGTCGAEGDNLTWELSCDSVLTISGEGEMQEYNWNSTPWYDRSGEIKTIIVENGVKTISKSAFSSCSILDSVSIGKDVTFIDDYVMYQLGNLRVMTCYAVTPPTVNGKSLSLNSNIVLYVPGQSVEAYKNAFRWKTYTTILPIPGTEVPEYPVIFLDYNSDVLSEQSVAEGSAAIAPEVPEREGYFFKGWNVDIEHIIARTFAIALYDKVGVEVTYKAEDGEEIFSEHADLHFPDAPSIEGKTFAGWLTENIDKNGIVLRATYTIDNPTTNDDVTVEPGSTSANVTFPFVTGAITYVLVIRDLFGRVVCKIMFNAYGRLLGIAFAPNRDRSQTSAQTDNFQFTVEGLDPSTTYEYEFIAHDETDDVIETLAGSFTTKAEIPTDLSDVQGDETQCKKVVMNDQVLILRGDKTYTVQGQEVK